jgi:hypothetical protein
MASPSTVISLGYGSWGSVNDVVTLGYGIGAVIGDPTSTIYADFAPGVLTFEFPAVAQMVSLSAPKVGTIFEKHIAFHDDSRITFHDGSNMIFHLGAAEVANIFVLRD